MFLRVCNFNQVIYHSTVSQGVQNFSLFRIHLPISFHTDICHFLSNNMSSISGRPELNTLYTLVHQYFSASRTSLTIQHSYICHLTLSLIYPQRHIYNSYFFIFPKNSQIEYQNFSESHHQF